MKKRIILFSLIGLFAGQINAQRKVGVTTQTMSSTGPGSSANYYYGGRSEPPRAIEFNERTVAPSTFIANINTYLGIPVEFSFTEVESNTDKLGMRHRMLQQHYKGIPIEGMVYRVHERNGFVTSANGKAVRAIGHLETQTTINERHAFYLATEYLHSKDSVFRPGKRLIVSRGFTLAPESFSVAYQFDIDVSFIEQWRVSIDARTGQMINKVSLVNTCFTDPVQPPMPYGTGTGKSSYYGTRTIQVEKLGGESSRMVGETAHGGSVGTYDFANVNILSLLWFWEWHKVYDFYSSTNTYNDPYHKTAVSAQWGMEQAFEYYFTVHNRNSYDNLGSPLKSYVHVDRDLNNAFWTHNLLAFGDGSNNNPLVELDVVGHELSHGVTQYEANLQYYGETGALNESFSDILGKAIEFHTFGDTATWQLARHYQPGGLRDMSNPNLKNQPDTYFGDLWFSGPEDNGGVHYNSGVQNFWFYLLCKGGSGVNDQQKSYTVNAIGMDAAVKIVYRNLTEYLSYESDYLDSRIGSMLATADLYGKNSAAYQEVDKAWDAVGVIDEPIITSLEVYDITGTTAKLRGSIEPRGDTVTYKFEYGTTPAYGSATPDYNYTNTIAGTLTGLQSQTKYYVRLVVTNEHGASYYGKEFTTISLAPMVKIKPTIDVTETTAIVHGEVNPNSLATSFYFEYGTTTALGSVTATYPLPDTTEYLKVSAPISNLQPRQTYYYRLKATNASASVITESMTFYTASKPVISSYTPASGPIGTEVTITGQNFNPTAAKDIVAFGATKATVLSASLTELKVQVPAGASLGPISVLDAESGLIAESSKDFVPTFTGEFRRGSLQMRVGVNDVGIYQVFAEDMDGDHRPDIVARHYPGFSVYQNVNQGGDITDASFVRNTTQAEFTDILYLVDFDGNGLKDVVGRINNGLKVYPNYSVPGYIYFGIPIDIPTGYFWDVCFNDFDLDGRIDIGLTTYEDNGSGTLFKVFRNKNPKGIIAGENFQKEFSMLIPDYQGYRIYPGDLNNDERVDLVLTPDNRTFIPILKNNSEPGTFAFGETRIQDPTQSLSPVFHVRDLNQDGWRDVASLSPYALEALRILENQGSSPNISLSNPSVIFSDYSKQSMETGDVDGDGKVDLLVGMSRRKFLFFKNTAVPGTPITSTSFEKFADYGMELPSYETGSAYPYVIVNDLNGDGRPEVINANSYYYGPHDGYQMEIWQNAPNSDCLDASRITVSASLYNATIVLPGNTTLDQYEIEYTSDGWSYWNRLWSTEFYVTPGNKYTVRARSKCYLTFGEYYYIDFMTDCVDTRGIAITNVGPTTAIISVSNVDVGSFEIEYSVAGENAWIPVPQYQIELSGLQPGTTYDIRFRGRYCYYPAEFTVKQFTTLCPSLSDILVTELTYNRATVSAVTNYSGDAILEYSTNNVTWTLIDKTRAFALATPGIVYYLRGKLVCTNGYSSYIQTSFRAPCPAASALDVDTVTPFGATVHWMDQSSTGSYALRYYMLPTGSMRYLETNATAFTLENLQPGAQYRLSVAPTCIGEEEFVSIDFTTDCYALFDLSVENVSYTTAVLTWSDDYAGVSYAVDYSIAGQNNWQTMQVTATQATLPGLRPGTEYEVRVHINCVSQNAPYIGVRFTTALYEETTYSPNPTSDIITISPSKNLIGNRFIILESTGRIMVDAELQEYTIDFSHFAAGVYTLKIDGEKPVRILRQ